MTNVTILQNNKNAKHFCSLPGSPRRLANLRDVQHLARLQEVSLVWCIYTIRALYISLWHMQYMCKYDIYVTYTFCYHIKKILARRAWSYRRTRTAAVSRLDLLLKVLFDDSIQNACTIFTIPPPLCFGRPISFMVLVNCKSIASQSINRADTRSHLTAPD